MWNNTKSVEVIKLTKLIKIIKMIKGDYNINRIIDINKIS